MWRKYLPSGMNSSLWLWDLPELRVLCVQFCVVALAQQCWSASGKTSHCASHKVSGTSFFFFSSVNELKTLCCLSKHSSICYQDFSYLSKLCDILLTIAACVVFTHHASFVELQAASVTFKFPVFSAKCSWHLKTSRWKRCFMIFF